MITVGRLWGIALISIVITLYAVIVMTGKYPTEKKKNVLFVFVLFLYFYANLSALIFGAMMIYRG